ncbi:MAG: hypothetical protein U9P72_05685 [Campylobacterota bacterium]|nr:hypothetical protein [Campylobacterota bacterium]
MKTLSFLILVFATTFFTACSSKKVYEPELIAGDWKHYGDTNETISDVTSNVALLQSGKVISKDSLIEIKIEKSFRVLSSSDGWIISSNIDGNLTLEYIDDSSMKENFELKKTIAAASVKDNILAVLFADNEMALYSISTKEVIFKEKGNSQKIIDSRVVNPYFMNDLVLFSTLDGKVIIINSKLKKRLRTVIVSSEDNFNNIIYFNIIDDKIIAVTSHKMLSMGEKEIRVKYELRNIIDSDGDIFITTKQGEVISLTPDLQPQARVKFPFAHFLGMITHNDKLYLLEKDGYIIEITKDLLKYKVYSVDIEDGYIFVADKKFYVHDEYISIEIE